MNQKPLSHCHILLREGQTPITNGQCVSNLITSVSQSKTKSFFFAYFCLRLWRTTSSNLGVGRHDWMIPISEEDGRICVLRSTILPDRCAVLRGFRDEGVEIEDEVH